MHGLSRLSVGDVAKRAGLSRQTLYKHFDSREDLIAQTVLRETSRIVEQVVAASEAEPEPEASLEAAILTALLAVRSHPLLDRLLATEPESLLPLLVEGSGSVQETMSLVCRQVLHARLPELGEVQVRAGADVLSRMLVSYAVRPPEDDPAAVARFLCRSLVAGMTPDPNPPVASTPAATA